MGKIIDKYYLYYNAMKFKKQSWLKLHIWQFWILILIGLFNYNKMIFKAMSISNTVYAFLIENKNSFCQLNPRKL